MKRRRCTCSAIFSNYLQPVRSSFLIAVGTIALGSNMSWGSARTNSTSAFCNSALRSKNISSKGGIQLIKIWLEVGKEEQERRFLARISDPLRQWKLSPMDLEFIQQVVRLLPRPRYDV